MCLPRLLMLLVLLSSSLSLATSMALGDDVPDRPGEVSAELWDELVALDALAGEVTSLRGRFERHRSTPLLRRPLVSEGVVYVSGDRVRWETQAPSPSTTLVRDGEVQIYQPEERRVEVYALEERAEQFGGGLMLRLTTLVETFCLAEVEPGEVFEDLAGDDVAGLLGLRLTPRDEAITEEFESMAMLLDRETGQLLRLRLVTDASQWTEYRFVEVEPNVELGEDTFTLELPTDVEVVRPMEGGSRD
ncbi:outer membrane lipoprotein carrier protein LolA [Phycisphaerales bacterium AB-hyl4]|uniref:Outer membrane lipoprotein carrier protein LolA n=1 Tax=Natronomicrosphaera hydrolytica TaxID=3242702 RepID=A0ABV4U5Y0_9BACT